MCVEFRDNTGEAFGSIRELEEFLKVEAIPPTDEKDVCLCNVHIQAMAEKADKEAYFADEDDEIFKVYSFRDSPERIRIGESIKKYQEEFRRREREEQ